jgi:DNA-binding GntR family transcriptional regulator
VNARGDDFPSLTSVGRPHSLSELAYQQLRAGILAGEFGVGRRFSVVTVAERLSISRSPVRAAVERLSAEGLISIDATGIEVRGYDRDDLLQTLAVRAPLEVLAARLATQNASPGQRGELLGIQDRFRESIDHNDPVGAYEYDVGFHQHVWEICGNAVLTQELQRLHARAIVASQTVKWAPIPAALVPEHDEIASAIIAGDVERAAAVSARHMEHIVERVRTGASYPA